MSQLLFLIALLVTGSSKPTSVDQGVPSINAVCQVKLKSGAIKQGMLCVVKGGYFYQNNGFAYKYPDSDVFQYRLFSVADFSLKSDLGPSMIDRKTGKERFPDLYFMAAQHRVGVKSDNSFDENSGEHTVTMAVTHRFKVLQQFHLYEELPSSLYLPQEEDEGQQAELRNRLKKTVIAVDNIEELILVENPSATWLNKIQQARERLKASGDLTDEYQEPLWYHEIKKDKDLYKSIQDRVTPDRVPYFFSN